MKKLGNFAQIIILGVMVIFLVYILNISGKNYSLSGANSSIEESEVTTLAPTEVSTEIVVTPTATPGSDLAMATPTPINVDTLPEPQPGAANAFGRVLCNGLPLKPLHPIFLIFVEDGKYFIVKEDTTDENGVWFLQDAPPGTYTIMNKPPADFGDTLLSTWEVPANQIADFGDVDFVSVGCEP